VNPAAGDLYLAFRWFVVEIHPDEMFATICLVWQQGRCLSADFPDFENN
jgi:hypothetical protein